MKVILDTDFLSSFIKIDRLELIKRFFKVRYLIITTQVYDELRISDFFPKVAKVFVFDRGKLSEDGFILVKVSEEIKDKKLGSGEKSAIKMAQRMKDSVLLMDDKLARKRAEILGIEVYSIPTFLNACKEKGIISKKEICDVIKNLKKRDHYEFNEDIKQQLIK